MELKLNKEELLTLSEDAEVLADELTPQVGGGGDTIMTVDICPRTHIPAETCGVYTCPPIF